MGAPGAPASPASVSGGGGVNYSPPDGEEVDINVLIFRRLNEMSEAQQRRETAHEALKVSVDALIERVAKLEVSEKFTRWAIGGICFISGMFLREAVRLLMQAFAAGG